MKCEFRTSFYMIRLHRMTRVENSSQDLFRLAKTKKEIDLTPGKQQIDLLHIDDICRGFGQLVIQSPAKNLPLGHIFDVAICRQSNNTLIEIIEKFNELSPQKLMCNFGARAYSPYDSLN